MKKKHKIFSKKRSRPFSWKSTLVSVGAAFLLSLGMGILLMRLFVSVDPSSSEVDKDEEVSMAKEKTEETVKMEADVFVIQTGAFSTEEEANGWKDRLVSGGIPALIWKRGEYYYLFIGQAPSKEEAQTIAAGIDAETYVKEWNVTGEIETDQLEKTTELVRQVEDGKLPDSEVAESVWGEEYDIPQPAEELGILAWLHFFEKQLFS